MHRAVLRSVLLLGAAFEYAAAQQDNNGLVTRADGEATITIDQPAGAAYRMVFPKDSYTPLPAGPVRGIVVASTGPNGVGTMYNILMMNLPTEGGPFLYHIHQKQVPDDGDCMATEGHLDPFQRGEKPPCNPAMPNTCQVGDLAGKHGAIPTSEGATTFRTSYVDDFTATGEGDAFMGNLSVVLHFANATRITCGNLQSMKDGGFGGKGGGGPGGGGPGGGGGGGGGPGRGGGGGGGGGRPGGGFGGAAPQAAPQAQGTPQGGAPQGSNAGNMLSLEELLAIAEAEDSNTA